MTNLNKNASPERLPAWLRRPLPGGRQYNGTGALVKSLNLATVCQGAKCPNIHECFSCGTATFMILGTTCTRNCAFCNIAPANPGPPDPSEPERLAQAAARLALKHIVITSVTRDDLPDGGAAHFAATIKAVQKVSSGSTIEVLIPDFQGNEGALNTVIAAAPNIINHNVETHSSLYPQIRPQANYKQSLELLARVAQSGLIAKSGFMVGIGETDENVHEILRDLKSAGCRIVTIGQYLRPSPNHAQVKRYVSPEIFTQYAAWGHALGLEYVFSAPLVRSSYQARETLEALFGKRPSAL